MRIPALVLRLGVLALLASCSHARLGVARRWVPASALQ
jgi:hypothetical protein